MATNNSCNYSPTQYGALIGGANGTITSIDPSTSGNVLTSNGTTWTSTVPTILNTTTVTITNSQLKNIHTSPVTLIPGAGSNSVISIYGVTCVFYYGGSNAFTGSNNLVLQFAPGSSLTLVAASDITGTTSLVNTPQLTLISGTLANFENSPVTVTASANYSGNAANNNLVYVQAVYSIITV